MKRIYIIFIITVIIALGYYYHQWDLSSQERGYIYLKAINSRGLNYIMLKKLPSSLCVNDKDDYVRIAKEDCPDCIITSTDCMPEVPDEYKGVFENKAFDFSYLSLNFKYPERYIPLEFSEEDFENLCDIMTKEYSEAVCVRKGLSI